MSTLLLYYREVTPVAGAVTWNTIHLHGEILSVHVKPTTASTTFKIKIKGKNGLVIWESEQDGSGETGEIQPAIINKGVNEVCSIELSSASVDELFKVEIRLKQYVTQR